MKLEDRSPILEGDVDEARCLEFLDMLIQELEALP